MVYFMGRYDYIPDINRFIAGKKDYVVSFSEPLVEPPEIEEEAYDPSWQSVALQNLKQLNKADLMRKMESIANNKNEYNPQWLQEGLKFASRLSRNTLVQLIHKRNTGGSRKMWDMLSRMMNDSEYLKSFEVDYDPGLHYEEEEENYREMLERLSANFKYIRFSDIETMKSWHFEDIRKILDLIFNPSGGYPFDEGKYMSYYGNLGINIPMGFKIHQGETIRAWNGEQKSAFAPVMKTARRFKLYKKVIRSPAWGQSRYLDAWYSKKKFRGKFVIIEPVHWFVDTPDVDRVVDMLISDLHWLPVRKWEKAPPTSVNGVEYGSSKTGRYYTYNLGVLMGEMFFALDMIKRELGMVAWPILPNFLFSGTMPKELIMWNWEAIHKTIKKFLKKEGVY